MNPPNETTVEELQLLDRQKTNNRVGLDPDTSLAADTAQRIALDSDLYMAVLAAETRGYTRGYAAAWAEIDSNIAASAAEVIRNVVSDRSRTWAPPGQPQRKGIAA